jgi:hypothetical protein
MSKTGSRILHSVREGRAPVGDGDMFGDMLAELFGLTLPSRDPLEQPVDASEVPSKPVRKAARPRKRPPAP